MGDDCEEAVDEPDCRDGSEKDKPEVEEDVDLFIDDVQGKNTEGIMFLNCSRGAIFLEEALCNLKQDNMMQFISVPLIEFKLIWIPLQILITN